MINASLENNAMLTGRECVNWCQAYHDAQMSVVNQGQEGFIVMTIAAIIIMGLFAWKTSSMRRQLAKAKEELKECIGKKETCAQCVLKT